MLPLFVAVIGFACSSENFVSDIFETEGSLVASHILQVTIAFVIIMVHLHVIRACFHKFIPRLLILTWIGLILAFASELSHTLLIAFSHNPRIYNSPNNNNYALLLPQMLWGISYALTVTASMEFTIAQAPIYVRGLMVSIFYASLGIGYCITMITLYLFRDNAFYYYLTKNTLVLFSVVAFAILAKRYKYRVRENEVHIYEIASNHYQRYIEQEEQYNKWNKDQNVFFDSI